MRVLHVHSGNLYGGVETTLLAQARHRAPDLNLELSFALCFEGRFSEELGETAASAYWLNPVRVRNPFSIRKARQRLRLLLQEEHFDVVVTHSCWSQAIFGAVVKESKLPLVFWLHGAAQGSYWLERWARRTQPNLALCNSHFTASTLPRLYQDVPVAVVYPPHELTKVHLSISERQAIRSELGTPGDAVVIIQVSRMEPGKGHGLLLDALSKLKELPGWFCWQVGTAQLPIEVRYLRKLKEAAVRLGVADRVRFIEGRVDVTSVFESADIFCQPNVSPEGFGLTFIEALAARLPIVTTAFGGAEEIIDSTCGLLLDLKDSDALVTSLRTLIENPAIRRGLGRSGPSVARKRCDVSSQTALLHRHFARVRR